MSGIKKLMIILGILTLVKMHSACESSDQVFQITAINLMPHGADSEFNRETGIGFEIQTDEQRISSHRIFSPLTTPCYAQIDPDRYVKHPLDTNSFDLQLDKYIIVDSDTIPPFTNILSVGFLQANLFFLQSTRNGRTNFGFKENGEFYKKIITGNQRYRVNFRCKTTDGKTFEDSIEMNFNFQ